MINFSFKKNLNILLVLILFLGIKSSFASETFNNNLLKTELHKSSIGGIKIDLYTGKPYSDAVSVNKKSANEYVILLPETSNSLTAKPSLSHVSDVVKSVEVKSQSYQNNIKGYTKIIVHSYQPIEISTHVQSVNSNNVKITENEYKELISQATKKTAAVKPKITKAAPQKLNNSKSVKKTLAVDKKQTTKVLPSKPLISKPSKVLVSANSIKKQHKSVKSVEKIIAPKNTLTSSNQKVQSAVSNKPVAVNTKVEGVSKKSEAISQPKQPETVANVQSPQIQPVAEKKNVSKTPINNVLSISFIKTKIYKLVQLAKSNLYYAIAAVIAAFLFLLVIARKMSSGIKRSQVNFASNLQDKPTTPINYQDKITDDMTWKEKFKACSDNELNIAESDLKDDIDLKNTPIVEPQKMDGFIPSNDELDELFNPENIIEDAVVEDETAESEQIFEDETEQIFEDETEQMSDDLDEFYTEEDLLGSDISVDDIFYEDEIATPPNFLQNEIVSEPVVDEQSILDENSISDEDVEIEDDALESNLVKSEFVIDEKTAFYLVDYENNSALVGRINENFFVLKQFDEKIDAPLKARLNEQTLNSVSYMTKIGGFRGVVEVTPDKMDLLIEL